MTEEIIAYLFPIDQHVFDVGVNIGKLYTDFGMPIDMSLDKIGGDKKTKAQMLFGAQSWLIEHRKNSNATDKALDRQRKINVSAMESFIKTGECGIY